MKKLFAILLCAALMTGCDSNTRRDAADERNPLVQKGLEQAQLKRWDDAIRQFEEALARNPKLARPDLELALIYHQHKKNYVRAIYHYERYLEKRPDSEKRQLLLGWIGQARISFAADVGQTSASGVSEELLRLTRENNLLRKQLERAAGTEPAGTAPTVTKVKTVITEPPPAAAQRAMEDRPRQAVESTPAPQPAPATRQPVERIQTPPPVSGTYTVRPGDTLTRIAKAIYGDGSRWKEIYAANTDKMQNENDLKAGQTITIPNIGN